MVCLITGSKSIFLCINSIQFIMPYSFRRSIPSAVMMMALVAGVVHVFPGIIRDHHFCLSDLSSLPYRSPALRDDSMVAESKSGGTEFRGNDTCFIYYSILPGRRFIGVVPTGLEYGRVSYIYHTAVPQSGTSVWQRNSGYFILKW